MADNRLRDRTTLAARFIDGVESGVLVFTDGLSVGGETWVNGGGQLPPAGSVLLFIDGPLTSVDSLGIQLEYLG